MLEFLLRQASSNLGCHTESTSPITMLSWLLICRTLGLLPMNTLIKHKSGRNAGMTNVVHLPSCLWLIEWWFLSEVKGKKWKLSRPYLGPYRVQSLTPTNAEVMFVDKPDEDSVFMSFWTEWGCVIWKWLMKHGLVARANMLSKRMSLQMYLCPQWRMLSVVRLDLSLGQWVFIVFNPQRSKHWSLTLILCVNSSWLVSYVVYKPGTHYLHDFCCLGCAILSLRMNCNLGGGIVKIKDM